MTEHLDWHGCYDEGWRGLIVDEAFAHPAKAARGLVRRIFAHMESQGWLPPRSRVLDVFGGIGATAIEGASRGHEVVCVELEERFFKLAMENFQLHRRMWESAGDPMPVMLHGDSRKAVELVRGHFAACVGSPPFVGCLADVTNRKDTKMVRRNLPSPQAVAAYLKECRLERNLTAREIDRQLGTSTLYSWYEGRPAGIETPTPEHWLKLKSILGLDDRFDAGILTVEEVEATSKNTTDKTGHAKTPHYGQTPGQIGAMPEGSVDAAIGSPPYAASIKGEHSETETAKESHAARSDPKAGGSLGKSQRHGGYGGKDNLGNLAEGDVDAVLSSPPYEADVTPRMVGSKGTLESPRYYGKESGQLGAESGETFWLASRTILEQVHQLMKSGGEPVADGKDIDFCDCPCSHS